MVNISSTTAKKLEAEDTDFHHRTIPISFKLALCTARIDNNMTQAILANRINEKKSIIVNYESGNAVPECRIIQKLNRVLNVKLPPIPRLHNTKKEVISIRKDTAQIKL